MKKHTLNVQFCEGSKRRTSGRAYVRCERPLALSEMRALVRFILQQHDIEAEEIAFSKHVGCTMCPCSPGFIIRGTSMRSDLWITVEEES